MKTNWYRVAQNLENVESLETLTDRELTRALRDAIIAEESAIKQYEAVADSTDNERVTRVLQDIANEERVHVGELMQLLAELLDDEDDFIEEGREEIKGEEE
jgi:rubrerythrin